ncbi:MAG: LPD1 domain-containing protein, partial [Pseudomonadota bacterium]
AREGVIEPGQRPRMPAPVVEEVETEVVTDEDYRANLDGDSVFTVGDTNSNATLEIVRDLTSDPEGARSRFGMEMDVVTMSPEEYIQRATELRAQSDQTTAEFERTKRESRTDKIDDIAQKMRDGETFAAPSLDMAGEGFVQDGLHRAMAAQQLGIPRIPVSIVRDAVPDTPAAEAHQAEGADALAESTPEETAPPAPEVAAEEAPEQATPEPEAVVEPETAEVRPEAEEAPAETQQSEDPGTPARGPEEVGATAEPATASRGSLQDVGEKIGAARKDTSTQTGRAKRAQPKSDQPAWRRRFSVSEIVAGSDKGKFAINDSRQRKNLFRRGGPVFETQEDAEAAIPLFAVAQKHRVRSVQGSDGRVFEIWRTINNRKMVKVVDQQFDGREAANLYMAKNAEQIIETNTTFGEADLPKPDDLNREGPERRTGDVDGEKVMETFGLRAVEFGNWNNQDERQEAVNAAYDGLADLADILGIPAKAIGLNGDLALAFGARGHGLSGAKAHYEPQRAVINLTKMRGAGSLAYEWFHALDHYFDRIDKKNRPQWQTEEDGTRTLADRGFATEGLNPSGNVRPEIREALINIVQTMKTKAVEYVEETQNVDHFVGRAREDLAGQLQRLRNHLADELRYRKRNSKPASAEQLAEFDRIADTLLAGESLTTEIRSVEDGSRRRGVMAGMRLTNDALDGLSAILKKVRGTTGFRADGVGLLDSLRSPMTRYNQRLKQMADAQAGETKIKRVPTDFSMNARELDQGRGENYWTTTIEMAARAFQGYVEDRVADQGGRSPFLNFGPENAAIITPWGFKRPFPAGEERQAINEAFDAFVEKLKTRETETGVALFRSKDAPGQGSTVGQVSQYIDGMPEQLLDRVRVVQSIEDVPDSARDEMRRQGATAISGFFERDSQSVWLVADGIRNKRSAQATL